jgi:hypothetical protein
VSPYSIFPAGTLRTIRCAKDSHTRENSRAGALRCMIVLPEPVSVPASFSSEAYIRSNCGGFPVLEYQIFFSSCLTYSELALQ